MLAGLADVMAAWNFPLAPDSCCELHASLGLVRSLCEFLAGQQCAGLGRPGERVCQCPVCLAVLSLGEGDSSPVEFECHRCGYEGPPGTLVVASPPARPPPASP